MTIRRALTTFAVVSMVATGFGVVSPAASAQTRIQLSTVYGNCTATTDGNGLVLANSGTDLVGNGVVMSESTQGACSPNGYQPPPPPQANFNTSVSVSNTNPAVGTQFNVNWSASIDATACVRGGQFSNVSGIGGWALGSLACSGASCAGNHAETVTASAPGSYLFSVTCTNSSGHALTNAPAIVPQPPTPAPSPNPISLIAPANATAGDTFAVTWSTMSNTASCTGTASFNGTLYQGIGDWTTSTSIAGPRNVILPSTMTAGTLDLTLTCWNGDHSASATGTHRITIAAIPPTACPATITVNGQTRNRVTVAPSLGYGAIPQGWRNNTPALNWIDIFGYANSTSTTPAPWPGISSSPHIKNFPKNGYLGLKFRTMAHPRPPATGFPGEGGQMSVPNTSINPNLIAAISTQCGSFDAGLPTPGCQAINQPGGVSWTGIPSSGDKLIYYKFTTTSGSFYCNLQPDTEYYLNIMYANPELYPDPAQVPTTCRSDGTCTLSVHHTVNGD